MKIGEKFVYELDVETTGEYDVIVCGGGTAGCAAALAAARNGASVALVESSFYLGGMISGGNAGLTKYVSHAEDPDIQTEIFNEIRAGNRESQPVGGIALELAERMIADGNAKGTAGTGTSYVYTDSQEFKLLLFELLLDAGVKICLHSTVCGVLRDESETRITGVVMLTKSGPRALIGKFIIDSTGDGDVAALAGVPFVIGAGPEDAVVQQGLAKVGDIQNIGWMFRVGGVELDKYVDAIREHPEYFMVHPFGKMTREEFIRAWDADEMVIGWGVTDKGRRFQIYNYPHEGIMIGCISIPGNRNGVDADELTLAEYDLLKMAKTVVADIRGHVPGFDNIYVLDTPTAGVRETRHIEGVYKLNITDIVTGREFEDCIGVSCHPIDIRPFPNELKDYPTPERFFFQIPYRCLIAKGYDNLLLAGRCVSNTREAAGCTRVTTACMITGEAAGTAVALCSKAGVAKAADIDSGVLRATLRANGVKC